MAGLATMVLATLSLASAAIGITLTNAAFSAQADLGGNTLSTSSDWVAPDVVRAVIAPTSGSTGGYVGQGSSYYVYAQASDTGGDPPSGVASVSANVSNVTSGATSAALTAGGPWTVGGLSYNYRSAALAANTSLAEGAKSYTVSATDGATNTTSEPFSVTVDNGAPSIGAWIIRLDSNSNLVGGQNPGYIGQGLNYRVYANIADSSSGVEGATVNLANITTGQTAATMSYSATGWTANGTVYNWRTDLITANASMANGSTPSFTITASDAAGNSANANDTATVDNNATIQPPTNFSVSASCAAQSITFVGAASSWSSSGSSLIVSKPAGTAAGDLLIAAAYGRFAPVSGPSGWTVLHTQSNLRVWYKFAGASEPASYNLGSNERSAGGISVYRNVSSASPINVYGGASLSNSTIRAPSVTTTVSSALLVAVYGNNDSGAHTTPASITDRLSQASNDSGSSGHQVRLTVGDETLGGPGATGNRDASAPTTTNAGISIALAPSTFPRVSASWTITPSTFATGHRLRRYVNNTFQQGFSITPRTTSSYADDNISGGTEYEYRLRAYVTSGGVTWESAQLSAFTTPSSCSP